jgi:tetratricopeptide (TPR) repeat protein
MRRSTLILLLTIVTPALTSLAQVPTGDSPVDVLSRNLSDLQLDEGPRSELENALKGRQFKRAETILVTEAEKDPKSLRTVRLLVLAGGVFFLDGQYLNSAIAWKKAEAIAPLDDRTRFTLAMAYVKLKHEEWAKPELEKLSEASGHQNPLYLYWLARLDYDSQNYAVAIDRLQKVVQLDPGMVRAYDTLGLCYDYIDQFDEAIRSYNKAVVLNRHQSKPSPWPNVDLAVTLMTVDQPRPRRTCARRSVTTPSFPRRIISLPERWKCRAASKPRWSP